MTKGLEITLKLLAQTENRHAAAVLTAALNAPQKAIQEGALDALARRKSKSGGIEVLRLWRKAGERFREAATRRGDWLSEAIKEAILGGDEELRQSAGEVAVRTADYEQVAALVQAALRGDRDQAAFAARTALELCDRLAEELHAPRDYRNRRDPQALWAYLSPRLEEAALQVAAHGQSELVEALLVLASRDNSTLSHIMQSPQDPAFPFVEAALKNSPRAGVIRRLTSYLDDPRAPRPALQVLAARRDLPFLRQLTRRIGAAPSPAVKHNLHRIDALPALPEYLALLDALSEAEQPGLVQLVACAGIPRPEALAAVAVVLHNGGLAGRRCAAALLPTFTGGEAEELAGQALDDPDPLVRAAAARRLQHCDRPGLFSRFLALLESPHEAERQAARECLSEFTTARYLETFDGMDDQARTENGLLVRQADPHYAARLSQELLAGGRARRARALQAASAMNCVEEILPAVGEALRDEDPFVRIEAALALAQASGAESGALLEQLRGDPDPLVQRTVRDAQDRRLRRSTLLPGAAVLRSLRARDVARESSS